MTFNRRRIMQLIGISPVAAAAAGSATPPRPYPGWIIAGGATQAETANISREMISKIVKTSGHRSEIESIIFEHTDRNPWIPPDIDVYRSFSRAAKIVYARRRLVDAQLKEMEATEFLGDRVGRYLRKVAFGR